MGLKVVLWTVNDISRASELIDLGVDGLITDYPEDFLKKLKTSDNR
jgi:glycerophosphoryl diester phosphodiesterase